MIPKTVDTSVICTWLGIPPDQWPPDHYTLLGLPPGEQNADNIERHVQQRLEQVRHYQLTNPEPATEAMNRIAQAFVCLTDPQARRAYDRSLFGDTAPAPSTPTPIPSVPEPAEQAVDPGFLSLVEEEVRAGETAQAAVAQTATEEVGEPEDPALVAARQSPSAKRGLGTKRALYERIVRTRMLLRFWEKAGRYLGQPKKRLSRPSEARDLIEV